VIEIVRVQRECLFPIVPAGRDQEDVIVVWRELRPNNPSAVVVMVASASPRVTAASSL